jgi:hypothetical protein
MATSKRLLSVVLIGLFVTALAAGGATHAAGLRAGAGVADVTPQRLPVRMAGMFLVRYAERIHSPLKARAIALEDDRVRMVIAVVDSVGMPREILDDAKRQASLATGIPVDRMLVSATHTHTAPPVRMSHGTDPDLQYAEVLRRGIVEAIERAAKNLVPAKVGAAVADARDFAAVRRWILRPDRIGEDPFGNRTVRASMHTARNHDDVTGPSGPMDPDLSLVSFQTMDGKPIALLANFANHYAGAPRVDEVLAVSADYFGLFADTVEERLGSDRNAADETAPFVAVMSQGTSGDIATRDYWQPNKPRAGFEEYTRGIVDLALRTYEGIQHRSDVTLEMAQAELTIAYRTPDAQRLEWARGVFGDLDSGRVPTNQQEVYARHALHLERRQGTRLLLQAVRIGDIGITAIPNEVYALTGLRLKELSPLPTTINIELANGSEGYLPPPEQHVLGGYNTWPALSACLEINAEPRIVQTMLELLERVSSKPRRLPGLHRGPASEAVLGAQPLSYFRMNEFAGPRAVDNNARHDGVYESGVVFQLPGPRGGAFSRSRHGNRAAHFAGGRMRVAIPNLPEVYSVSLWFWNGMVTSVRSATGYLFSRDRDWSLGPEGEHLGIGGTAGDEGRLIFHIGNGEGGVSGGRTQLKRWHWHHVALVRDGKHVRIYLDGAKHPEIDVVAPEPAGHHIEQLFVGGRSDNQLNFEGRIDEVAVFDRALSVQEILAIYDAAE